MSVLAFPTKRFWHCAASPIHQSVAVSAFLWAANQSGVPVYYGCNPRTERRLQHLVRSFHLPVQRAPTDDNGHILVTVETDWWWIGTHDTPVLYRCPTVWTSRMQPQVSLCLSLMEETSPTKMLDGHVAYITGQPIY